MTETVAVAPYHVRAEVDPEVQNDLQNEQAKRQLAGKGRVSLMTIAAEWIEEIAAQKRVQRSEAA